MDIAFFMYLGKQYFPMDTDHEITFGQISRFIDRVHEEVTETWDAAGTSEDSPNAPVKNLPEVLDGFIDTAYVALTGAIRLVGPEKAARAWDAVVDANLSKVDRRYGAPIINEETGKIGKPEGWKAPDIEGIVYERVRK